MKVTVAVAPIHHVGEITVHSCYSAGLTCTTFCKYEANTDQFQNTFTVRSVNEVDEEDSDAVGDD